MFRFAVVAPKGEGTTATILPDQYKNLEEADESVEMVKASVETKSEIDFFHIVFVFANQFSFVLFLQRNLFAKLKISFLNVFNIDSFPFFQTTA